MRAPARSAARARTLFLNALLACTGTLGCAPEWQAASRRLAAGTESAPGSRNTPAPRGAPQRGAERTYFDGDRARPRSEITWRYAPGAAPVRDGLERQWYGNGQLALERNWREGEPRGAWSAWYESGVPRSRHDLDPTRATLQSWWHPNGVLSSRGPARGELREGRWRGWHENGLPAFEGGFRGGLREGAWTFWNADGALEASGTFRAGVRVGTWQHGPTLAPQ